MSTPTPQLPQTFRAALLPAPNQPLQIHTLPLPTPGPNQLLVRVLACGVCAGDAVVATGLLPQTSYPTVLGHEFVGNVVAVGPGTASDVSMSSSGPQHKGIQVGDRVGGAWHGGHDGTCPSCLRGSQQTCPSQQITGVNHHGAYAEYTLLRTQAAVRVPRDMDPASTAPFLCAGLTVFNGIRRMGIEPGNGFVAIQGLGGLGHLAVQYARAMGHRVVAVSRDEKKREFAMKELGAHEYVAADSPGVAAQKLTEMGGAALIVSTAPTASAFKGLEYGLRTGGKLLLLACAGPVEIDTTVLVLKQLTVHGWPSGTPLDAEEAIQFARLHGIRCFIEKFKLDEADRAFELMKAGKPKYRNVLVIE
ncbi:alcohol dehydrogenase GroES-like domain-containing protein [Pseudoneurospora amorphoporcata]|uniref:Alcohol dehydrogenase GroES-like domain-containing protein n=1 Tax=Pseudoneurospora amorphoporcata TaxID=241081 RepID=A0AAN6SB81_9PEZI|nr:alcohol dehydrogenase GroES-like domain-containing protein [Pseudoneurospora amorphoporcata]